MSEDPWADLEDTDKVTEISSARPSEPSGDINDEREARLVDLAERLYYIGREQDELREARNRSLVELNELMPEADEAQEDLGQWHIIIRRGERWTWDMDHVEKILAEDFDATRTPNTLPPFVDRKTSISRAAFERADAETQRKFLPALTRKPGSSTVKVWHDDKDAYP